MTRLHLAGVIDLAKKKTEKKSTKKSGKDSKSKEPKKTTAGSGYDPTLHYKEVPDGYAAVKKIKKAVEIRGRPIALSFDPETKTGEVTIEDISGKTHKASILKALMFDTIVHFIGERGTGFESKYRSATKGEREAMIKKALAFKPRTPILFRLAKEKDGLSVFGIMSNKWRQVAAEDYIDIVKDVLKKLDVKATYSLQESDGLHGGAIVVTPKGDDGVIQAEATFDFGFWDGYHRVRGVAGGQVLACSNQITIDVRGAMGQLEIGAFAALTELHTGQDLKFESLVTKVAEAIGSYNTIVGAAKNVTASKEKMEMIVQYYVDKGVLSKRTQEKIVECLKSDDIQQVKGTMFGLAMVLSYVGTHVDGFKDGVRGSLKALAGEILVVSQDPKGYWKLIKSHHEKRQSKEKQDAKVEKKADKKASKEKPKADKPKEAPKPEEKVKPVKEVKPKKPKAKKPKAKKPKAKK